jgi:hypothetical protein
MAHGDPDEFQPLDRGRVDVVDPNEVAYWCGEFGCDEAALRGAVEAVGTHTAAVREYLSDGTARA